MALEEEGGGVMWELGFYGDLSVQSILIVLGESGGGGRVLLFLLANHTQAPQHKNRGSVSFLHKSFRISIMSDQTSGVDELSNPNSDFSAQRPWTQRPWLLTLHEYSLLSIIILYFCIITFDLIIMGTGLSILMFLHD